MLSRLLRRAARAAVASLLTAASTAAQPPAVDATAEPAARPPGPTSAFDASARRRVADSVAAVLEARYQDPAVGRRIAAHLRSRAAAGAYDAAQSADAFGAALTRELQSVVADRHLYLTYDPGRQFALGPAPGGVSGAVSGAVRRDPIDGRDATELARVNFGFDRAERLEGNVGYLKLSQFFPLGLSGAVASAAMAFLAASDAVVIDLRGVPGGSPDLVTLLVSYFLGADPVKLMTSYNRAADATAERWSVRDLPGRRMTGVPLYVLQDANSASAAEMLSYFVQRQQVGTVVGETSAGAGNGGARLSVGAGLALFVPQMRIVDGPGWEQSGVTPDVRAPGDSALAVAHRLALERLIASAATAEARREREWALELARAAGRPARSDDADLRAYAGTFGARAFAPRDGALTLVGATGRTTRLVEVDRGVFRAREARYRFERDAAGRVTAVTVETLAGRRARDERAG